jgi:hypothetical protein
MRWVVATCRERAQTQISSSRRGASYTPGWCMLVLSECFRRLRERNGELSTPLEQHDKKRARTLVQCALRALPACRPCTHVVNCVRRTDKIETAWYVRVVACVRDLNVSQAAIASKR